MFWKLLSQAVKSIIENRRVLAKALSIPFLIYLTANFSVWFLPENTWVLYIPHILFLGIKTIFAVTTHRVVLLGPGAVPEWGLLKWAKRETVFTLYVLGLGAIMIAIGTLGIMASIFTKNVSNMMLFWGIVMWLAFYYFAGRFSLVFPSVAIGRSIGFKGSWEFSGRYDGLMMLIAFTLHIVFAIPELVNRVLSSPSLTNLLPYPALIDFFYNIIYLLVTVFSIATISVTYKYIVDETEKENSPETQTVG